MAHMLYSVLLHIKPVLLTFSVVITKLNQWSAFSADSEQRVRERDFRTTPANKDAGGATGGPWPEARPQSRSKVAQGDSNRTKAKKAAPKPAKQPEKQPRSSQVATCLLRLPRLTGMRQPAFRSRQHK